MLSLFDCQSVINFCQSFHPFASSKVTCDSSLDLQEAVKKQAGRLGKKGFLESDLFNLRFDAEKPGQLFRPPRDLSPEKLRLLINSFQERERDRGLSGIANTPGDLLQQRIVQVRTER